jgi:hypothetical protein
VHAGGETGLVRQALVHARRCEQQRIQEEHVRALVLGLHGAKDLLQERHDSL